MSDEPCVGIFWCLREAGRNARVTDLSPLSEADEYGDFLTHGRGHYEAWEDWKRRGPAWLASRRLPKAIAFTEYDDWPRGRIVHHVATSTFKIYADPRISADFLSELVDDARIPRASVTYALDAHYVSRSNSNNR